MILIIGANQGIGFHAAHQLAASGKYIVLLGSRDLTRGQKAIEEILADKTTSIVPSSIVPIQIDLTSDKSINAAVKTVEEKYGRLDIVRLKPLLNIPHITH